MSYDYLARYPEYRRSKAGLNVAVDRFAKYVRDRRHLSTVELVKGIDARGRSMFALLCCDKCGAPTTMFGSISHGLLSEEEKRKARVVRDDRGTKDYHCARCGQTDEPTEIHHWAPNEFFADSQDWPTSELCKKCHTLWHKIMNSQRPITRAERKEYYDKKYPPRPEGMSITEWLQLRRKDSEDGSRVPVPEVR
jgi:hypothetical protein